MIFKEPFDQYIGKMMHQEYGTNGMIQGIPYAFEVVEDDPDEPLLVFSVVEWKDYDKFFSSTITIPWSSGNYYANKTFVQESNEFARQLTIKGLFEIPRKNLQ
jgi:hypothetical protein